MINFKYVRWKNFLSTGNQPTEIQLDKNPTTLIIGENGAGKSTVLEIGRAHVRTPVTRGSRMPSSA